MGAKNLVAAFAAALAATGASVVSSPPALAAGIHQHAGAGYTTEQNVCSDLVAPGQARCFAHARTDDAARSARPARSGTASPAGTIGNSGAYDPAYLESAYNAPSSSAGAGQTVAIVDAYDDPRAESDLAYYRSYFHLSACTTANGCFRKVNQNGQQSSYPRADAGWAQEIALDLDMVSAICPSCHILLVEASDSSLVNLGTAVNRAVSLGASAVSNSYGGSEYGGETSDTAAYYTHPGVPIVVASGDSGYGAEYPAASKAVIAVGGTTLNQTTNTGTRSATETAWSGAGSGCSAFEPKPAWQSDTGCARRTIADASAVADPNTGVWMYDVYGTGGWGIFGGTSVATPIISSIYAMAANTSSTPASSLYASGASLNDVVSGSNGSCSPEYLCTAVAGYDGPTGNGTPNGTAAFASGPPPPPTTPSAPQNLTASPGNNSVKLSWSAPSSNGNSPISGYSVYRGTSPGGEGATAVGTTGGTTTTYADTTAVNGTTYFYTVTASNAASFTSQPSNEASATPAVATTVASAPRNLTAKTDPSRGVDLAWAAPTSSGGGGITGYRVYRSTHSGQETYLVASSCTATSCTFKDTNTKRGTVYYYELVAVNSAGNSPYSNQASAKAS
jgi:subtilase family serine protease